LASPSFPVQGIKAGGGGPSKKVLPRLRRVRFCFSASFRASTADAPNAKDREGLARRVAARFSLLSRAGNQSGWGRSIKKSPSAPAARACLLFRIFPCKHGRCSKRKR